MIADKISTYTDTAMKARPTHIHSCDWPGWLSPANSLRMGSIPEPYAKQINFQSELWLWLASLNQTWIQFYCVATTNLHQYCF